MNGNFSETGFYFPNIILPHQTLKELNLLVFCCLMKKQVFLLFYRFRRLQLPQAGLRGGHPELIDPEDAAAHPPPQRGTL